MSRALQLIVVVFLIVMSFMVFPRSALTFPPNCGWINSGSTSIWAVCAPTTAPWNGDLVVYAHGYVAPEEPLQIPEDELFLPDGTYIPDLVNSMGYYFATPSYPKNGLAVKEGLWDIAALVNVLKNQLSLNHVYLVGASEGGLITTLAVEKYPDLFSGGLALCGPIGDFRGQVDYWGDFRVVFDYFFPEVLPPSPVTIPSVVIENWGNQYAPAIIQAIALEPHATEQLLSVTQASVDPSDSASISETVLGVLWYNVFATNEAIIELNGRPFDNRKRRYLGSDDDKALKKGVERFKADRSALAGIATYYQTSGLLTKPLVTLHNTADPIVPYWHEDLYGTKVLTSGSSPLYAHIPIPRYGHCNFTVSEVLAGFGLLVTKVAGP